MVPIHTVVPIHTDRLHLASENDKEKNIKHEFLIHKLLIVLRLLALRLRLQLLLRLLLLLLTIFV